MSNTTVTEFVPTADQSVVEAYRAADQSGKGKIRADLTKKMQAAMGAMRAEEAFNLNATLQALVATKAAKVEVDPRLVVAQRIADLRLAADLLEKGMAVPTDLNWDTEADEALDFPEVEASEESARKIATTKLTKTDLRRSIDAVVERAFADKEEGDFLTVADIRKRGSIEGYVPSDGAIAARLFPKKGDMTLDGVEPVEAVPGKSPRGAVKTA